MTSMRTVAIILLAGLTLGAGPVTLPDLASGEIDGKVALMLWPSSEDGPLDAAGCTVHVVSDRGRGAESRSPCGQWFVPGPAGAYLVWLEQGDTIGRMLLDATPPVSGCWLSS